MGPQSLIDGHNDALLRLQRAVHMGEPLDFAGGIEGGHLDLPRARAGGFAGGFFACFVPPSFERSAIDENEMTFEVGGGWSLPYSPAIDELWARETTDAMIELLRELETAGTLTIVLTADELERALDEGVLAAILHIEGAEAIGDDLTRLDLLHARGLRSVGPVWSRPNRFGFGVPFRYPSSPDTGPGLTAEGQALVERCDELGVMLDLSHLNLKGFEDVARRSTKPLVATHTAAHALTPSARNITDAQIDLIGASDGIVGINLSVCDLREDGANDPDTPLERWAEHADHVAGRIGHAHVALGSDFDGCVVPSAVGDASGVAKLLDALAARGWDADQLTAFAHGNWLRVLRATWREA